MKKLGLFLIVMLFSAVGLTSCLDGGGNSSSGYAVGVIDYSSKNFNLILKSSVGNLYAPQLSNMTNGGCYYVSYTIDYDDEANSSTVVAANGYYTVSITGAAQAYSKEMLNSYLTDTSTVMTDELAISNGLVGNNILGYGGGYMFMVHELTAQPGYVVDWNLSYSPETMMPYVDGGTRYYDVFLRATKTPTAEKVTSAQYMNAYYMESYLKNAAQIEKTNLGSSYTTSSTLNLRINYASAISDSKITWSNKTLTVNISSFLN